MTSTRNEIPRELNILKKTRAKHIMNVVTCTVCGHISALCATFYDVLQSNNSGNSNKPETLYKAAAAIEI